MSLQEKEKKDKQTALKLTSASFVPKNLKKKTGESSNPTPPTQNTTPEVPNAPVGLGVLPPGIQGETPEKNNNVMPFPSLLGGAPSIDVNGIVPFPGGPMKPPPLLFSHPDNISILPLLNSSNQSAPKVKKQHLKYSPEFILSMKDK